MTMPHEPTVEELQKRVDRLKEHVKKLQAKKIENNQKRKVRTQKPAVTEKGTYLIARDVHTIVARYRHVEKDSALAEIKRLAKENQDRFLLLKVVGVLNKRPKQDTEDANA